MDISQLDDSYSYVAFINVQTEEVRFSESLEIKEEPQPSLTPLIEPKPDIVYSCHCGRTFTRKDGMKRHQQNCQETEGRTRCLHTDCHFTCYHKVQLLQHLKNVHNAEIEDIEKKSFQNSEDFFLWKESIEAQTFSYFTQQSGKKKYKNNTVRRYFICQHDGSDRIHCKAQTQRKSNRRNAKGQIKGNKTCVARMVMVEYSNGNVEVEYVPTHSHPLTFESTKHHPLPGSVIKQIKELLNKRVPGKHIQQIISDQMSLRTARSASSLARTIEAITRRSGIVPQEDDYEAYLDEHSSDLRDDHFSTSRCIAIPIHEEDPNSSLNILVEKLKRKTDPNPCEIMKKCRTNNIRDEKIINIESNMNEILDFIKSDSSESFLNRVQEVFEALSDECKAFQSSSLTCGLMIKTDISTDDETQADQVNDEDSDKDQFLSSCPPMNWSTSRP